jgi:Asp-tRNA(Asn)/Glu-tRNA(Gln) amidotransferase A subunit family amidase
LRSCAFALATLLSSSAFAEPARIIILRHAEKLNRHELCEIGSRRAKALAGQFLGKGAAQSLFAAGEKPAAILAVTFHSLETISPTAQSWELPAIVYSVLPGDDKDLKDVELNRRTREAVQDALTDPRYAGKTIVMSWEHKHIADAKLEAKFPNEQVTLRQLMHLDKFADAPKDWPEGNYDYFWIVDFTAGKAAPTGFHMVRESFKAPYDDLPANDWDTPEPRRLDGGCKK